MQRISHLALTAFVAVTATACGFLGPGMGPGMAPGGDMEAVGPRFELGPVRTFGADQQDGAGQRMVFFETRDGWCIETDSMGSCTGGAGLPTEGMEGFGASHGPEGTCIETVTGKDVVEIAVDTGDGIVTRLPPLQGSEQAPVNVFAACWATVVSPEQLTAEAYDADGEVIGTQEFG